MTLNSTSRLPMVSVIMITYNQEHLIADAIRGVVNQKTPFAIELIIANDASTDNTLEVARQWQKKYPHIIHIVNNTENIGFQRNYMTAVSHCHGKYLAMCDADDYWISSHKLSVQVDYMERHPDCNITFHRVINHYTDSGIKSLSNGHQKIDTTIADLCRSNYITNLSVMYRFDHGAAVELPSWISSTNLPDYAFHLLFARNGKIHYFNRPMGVYRKNSTGAWSMADPVKSLMMGVEGRILPLEHFRNNQMIADGLRSVCNRSLAKAAIIARQSTPPRDDSEFIRRYLLINPGKNISDFEQDITSQLNIKVNRLDTLKHRLLTSVRNIVSRIIPVPKPPQHP